MNDPHESGDKSHDAPFFSIVTVTLNSGTDLALTCDSVDAQTSLDYEHIVKDGGSTDDSLALVRNNPRRVVIRENDGGIFQAMNQSLASCRGRYVFFLNAGDRLAGATVLDGVQRAARETEADMLITSVLYEAAGAVRPYPQRMTRSYLFRQVPSQQAIYVRRELFDKFGVFDENYPCLSDQEFFLRLVLGARVKTVSLDLVGAAFKGGGFSASARFARDSRAERVRLRRQYFTGCERFIWTAYRWLVLHPVRENLNRRFPRGPVARLNHWCTARINKFFK